MVRQLHTKQSLLIALDLCQTAYQILFIIFLKDFIIANTQNINFLLNTYKSKIRI